MVAKALSANLSKLFKMVKSSLSLENQEKSQYSSFFSLYAQLSENLPLES